ncbi:MAG: class I SAM-dependent methyltransferase [Alcaligenaceae bacterium]|nr:class I SAM-dependent methyltransferase [Alcaligenaceae bacterium]
MSNLKDNMWHQRYSNDEYYYGTAPNDFLKQASNYIPVGSTVISLGEGEGRNAVFLAEQGHQVTAVDMALSGLEKVTKLAEGRGVKVATVHADLSEYPLEASAWDAAINIFCHMHKSLRPAFHQQIKNGLKSGGLVIFECYSTRQLEFKTGGPGNVDLLYTIEELEHDFIDMDIIHLEELEREIQEGEAHSGMSAVVQLIARKR